MQEGRIQRAKKVREQMNLCKEEREDKEVFLKN